MAFIDCQIRRLKPKYPEREDGQCCGNCLEYNKPVIWVFGYGCSSCKLGYLDGYSFQHCPDYSPTVTTLRGG